MQVQLNPFHMFTLKLVILVLPKKWLKMIWDKQLCTSNRGDGPFSTLLHIGHTTDGSVI